MRLIASVIHEVMNKEHQSNNTDRGQKSTPNATLSTTNPTWTGLGLHPRLRSKTLATNRLSHGTVPNLTSPNLT